MPKKSYLVSLLFAIAAHGALIFVSPDAIFRASLAVPSGSEALSIVLINHQSQSKPVNVSSETKKQATTQTLARVHHDLAPHLQSNSTHSTITQKVVTLSEAPNFLVTSTVTPEIKITKMSTVVQTAVSQAADQSHATKPTKTPVVNTSALSKNVLKSNSKHMLIVQTHKKNGAVSQAIAQSNHLPSYPRRAILRNQQGKVEVSLFVNEHGLATQPAVIKSSGYSLLDKSVLKFVAEETFIPAMQNGLAIASAQVFRFRFELN